MKENLKTKKRRSKMARGRREEDDPEKYIFFIFKSKHFDMSTPLELVCPGFLYIGLLLV